MYESETDSQEEEKELLVQFGLQVDVFQFTANPTSHQNWFLMYSMQMPFRIRLRLSTVDCRKEIQISSNDTFSLFQKIRATVGKTA